MNERRAATDEPSDSGGVGDAGAVHVHLHPHRVRGVGHGGDLGGGVHGAELGALGDRHDGGLHVVLVAEQPGEVAQLVGDELAVGARDVDQLGTGDALHRPGLVDVDVRPGGTHDGVRRSQQRRQAEHVAAGAGERQQRLAAAEQLGEPGMALAGPVVVAVGEGVALVGGDDRGDDVGVRPRRVVAGERSLRGRRKLHATVCAERHTRERGARRAGRRVSTDASDRGASRGASNRAACVAGERM